MPKALANGVSINYEERGSGFPMVLMHGLHGSHRNWNAQVDFFSDKYRVITTDSRGLGKSEAPPEPEKYSQDILVEDLHQLLISLGIQQAYIGGLSMGGNVALNFAIQHPEMTKAFISADTGSGSDDPEGFKQRMEKEAGRVEELGLAALKDEFLRRGNWAFIYEAGMEVYEPIERDFVNNSPVGIANTMRQVQGSRPTIYSLEAKLKAIQVPGLIIVGEHDQPCIGASSFMHDKIPNSRLVTIPGAGHNTHMETPLAFNQAVLDFLKLVEGQRAKRR